MKQKYIWMAVEPNELELPLAIADSAAELAKMFGTSGDAVRSAIRNGDSGRVAGRKFVKIIDDTEM